MDFIDERRRDSDARRRKGLVAAGAAAGVAALCALLWRLGVPGRRSQGSELAQAPPAGAARSGLLMPSPGATDAPGSRPRTAPPPPASLTRPGYGGEGDGVERSDLTDNWIDREGLEAKAALVERAAAEGARPPAAQPPRGATAALLENPPGAPSASAGASARRTAGETAAPAAEGSVNAGPGRGFAGANSRAAVAAASARSGETGRASAAIGAAALDSRVGPDLSARGSRVAPKVMDPENPSGGGSSGGSFGLAGTSPPAGDPKPSEGESPGTGEPGGGPVASRREVQAYRGRLQEVKAGLQVDVIAPMMDDVGRTLREYSPMVKEAREKIERLKRLNDADIARFKETHPGAASELSFVQCILTTGCEGVAGDRALLTTLRDVDESLDASIPCLRQFRSEFKSRRRGRERVASAAKMDDPDLVCARQAEKSLRLRAMRGSGMLRHLKQASKDLAPSKTEAVLERLRAAAGPGEAARLEASLAEYRTLIKAARDALAADPLGPARKDRSERGLSPKARARLRALADAGAAPQLPSGEGHEGKEVRYRVQDAVNALGDAEKAFGMRSEATGPDPAAQFAVGFVRAMETLYQLQQSIEILERVEPLAPANRP